MEKTAVMDKFIWERFERNERIRLNDASKDDVSNWRYNSSAAQLEEKGATDPCPSEAG